MAIPLIPIVSNALVSTALGAAVVKLVSFVFRSIAAVGLGYFALNSIWPAFIDLSGIDTLLNLIPPAGQYVLRVGGFYEGIKLCLAAIAAAWLFNKLMPSSKSLFAAGGK